MLTLVLSLVLLALASVARAEPLGRALLEPRVGSPAVSRPGGELSFVVRVASGLTPPPGVQTERALRGFSARVCAEGLAWGAAPERLCTPLFVRDVRPLDAHSLDYRVTVRSPIGLPDGHYDLGLRFPGGAAELARGVLFGAPLHEPLAIERGPEETVIVARAEQSTRLRVHLSEQGLDSEGGTLRFFPRHADDGSWDSGSVALLELAPGERARLRRPRRRSAPAHAAPAARLSVHAALPVALAVPEAWARRRVFWRFSPQRGAEGPHVVTRFLDPGRVEALATAIDEHGHSELHRVEVQVAPLVPGACRLTPGARHGQLAGLLFGALSWRLAARRGRTRRRE